MCGYAITFLEPRVNADKIDHRGLQKFSATHSYLVDGKRTNYDMVFFKLPFQTDLGDDWNQPIELPDNKYLLFNGEIFNVPKKYENDVAYLKDFFSEDNWLDKIGNEEYNQWDGFWSICIVTRYGIYAFTDPLGKKQLYYGEKGIASEIKPLLDDVCVPEEWFNRKNVEKTNLTPFGGIERILPNNLYKFYPSSLYKFSPNNGFFPIIEKRNLFDLHRKPKLDNLFALLEHSVLSRIHKKEDPETGIANTLFVSGGLDSTIVLDIICRSGNQHLFEFITVENQEDEKYIEILENHYGIKIRRVLSEGWSSFPNANKKYILSCYEYPLEKGSLLPNYFLCQFANSRSLLTGDGADELFSGYNRAQISDTQEFDVFTELPYYHNIRLDRMGMMFTKEVRCPFQSHEVVRWALNSPWTERKGKMQLKEIFKNRIPKEILERKKLPLRVIDRVENEENYDSNIIDMFNKTFFKNENS